MSTCLALAGSTARLGSTRRARAGSNRSRTGAQPARPLRLTTRGRFVIVLLLTLLAAAAFSMGRVSVDASGEARPTVRYVTVQPGETLWAIAERVAPAADPRDTVARLLEINGIEPGQLRAGQRLAVPARG